MVVPPTAPVPGVPPVPAADPNIKPVARSPMPVNVFNILQQYCIECHTYGQRDPAGWGSVLDLSRMIASDIVVPGSLEQSRLWYRVAVRSDMPFNGTRLSPEQKGVLQQWILTMQRPQQRPRTNEDILDILVQDSRRAGNSNDVRYISFAHFVDEGRTKEELAILEGVTNIMLNAMSRRPNLIRVEAADPDRSIFRFRISQLGWNAEDWDEIVRFYPYCLQSNVQAHQNLYDRLDTEAPYLRGDWFIDTTTLSPLYERLVDLGANLAEVQQDLNFDINENVRNRDVIRIAFGASGVSVNERMIERHDLGNGDYFWWSYDFANRLELSRVTERPLGPAKATGNEFQNVFEEAGGEAIFSLPNDMQAYFLTDANGVFLAEAPTNIVTDPRRRKGAVQNGLSCFGCHTESGMLFPKAYDDVPKYAEEHRNDFNVGELEAIREIYPRNGEQILRRDAARFSRSITALGRTTESSLQGGGVVEWDAWATLTGQYEAKIGLRGGSTELGISIAQARDLFRNERRSAENEDALPLLISDPLVAREEWFCRYREVIGENVRRGVEFCDGSFEEPTLQAFCDQLIND
jgi:mono/diheme cytochrome c family protein